MDEHKLMAALAAVLKRVTTIIKGSQFEAEVTSALTETVSFDEVERLAAEHDATTVATRAAPNENQREVAITTRSGRRVSSASITVSSSSAAPQSAAVVPTVSSSSSAAVPTVSSSSSGAGPSSAPTVSSSSSGAGPSSFGAANPAVSSSSSSAAVPPVSSSSSAAGPSSAPAVPSSSSGAGPSSVPAVSSSSSGAVPILSSSSSSAGPSGSSTKKSGWSMRKSLGSIGNNGASTVTITRANPQTILRLRAQQPAEEQGRKRPREDSDEEDDDPKEAIRAVIEEHFEASETGSVGEREARVQRRTSSVPPAGVAEAAERFRSMARASYESRYVAAYHARRLRDALRAEIDGGNGGEYAGMYWVAAGRKKKTHTRVSLGSRYPTADSQVQPVESRTLPVTWTEWRTYVRLFGHMEEFVRGMDGGDTEDNWALVLDLLPHIPFEAITALAPQHGASANCINFLCVHTRDILEITLEQYRKGDEKGKRKK